MNTAPAVGRYDGCSLVAAGGAAGRRVHVERQLVALRVLRVRLVPDRPAAGQGEHVRVAEAAHPRQAAEVVVERPVLLHEHDDVLDLRQ
jgi:hypothetical protein